MLEERRLTLEMSLVGLSSVIRIVGDLTLNCFYLLIINPLLMLSISNAQCEA